MHTLDQLSLALSTAWILAGFDAHTQALTLQLDAPAHNGYHVSCNSGKDGAIDLTITGGTPPYTIEWSTGATTEDVANLSAGYYRVGVTDNAGLSGSAEITLTEPEKFTAALVAYEWPSGYNIYCNGCYNGSIDLSVTGGVAPYAYAWGDGPTAEDRSNLGAGSYKVTVTDANGCEVDGGSIYLTEPERDDWTMGGNAGTNPPTQYLGTSDNKDVVFKSNGLERFKVKANGEISLLGSATDAGPLYLDVDGVLRGGGFPDLDPVPSYPCANSLVYPYWRTNGNTFPYPLCPGLVPRLGTRNAHPVHFITNDETWMILSVDGKLGIGATPPSGAINGYRLFVEDGIATRDVLVKLGSWPDFVFDDGYGLMPLKELRAFLSEHRHLPGIPSALELEAKDGFEVGEIQRRLVQVVEEQALYILELEERLEAMEQRMQALEASR